MPDMAAGSKASSRLEIELVEGVLKGRIRSVARMISMVENQSPGAIRCLKQLFPHTGKGFVLGVTGSPGAGKSTLVDQFAGVYRSKHEKVGIVAVDPTSPFTGGAILGDRIRMQSRSTDDGTYIRSMATRGHLGGLSRATVDAVSVLDAAGYGVVIIETVGVGQDEVEVVRAAQATVVVLVPGMGDDIQAMKAGIMEIGDVFVINKADHAGVERTEMELKALLSMGRREDAWEPPVIRTVATDGTGVEACMTAVESYRDFLRRSGKLRERALQIERYRLLEAVQGLLARRLTEAKGGARLDSLAGELAARSTDPYTAAEELLSGFVGRGGRSGADSMRPGLDHIGIAVRSLASMVPFYEKALGLEFKGIEEVPGQRVRAAMFQSGGIRTELLEGTDETSPVSRFIEKRGEGIHHICYRVDDLAAELDKLRNAGVRLVDEAPRPGAGGCLVAFVHPSSAGGVLIELSQHQHGGHEREEER